MSSHVPFLSCPVSLILKSPHHLRQVSYSVRPLDSPHPPASQQTSSRPHLEIDQSARWLGGLPINIHTQIIPDLYLQYSCGPGHLAVIYRRGPPWALHSVARPHPPTGGRPRPLNPHPHPELPPPSAAASVVRPGSAPRRGRGGVPRAQLEDSFERVLTWHIYRCGVDSENQIESYEFGFGC